MAQGTPVPISSGQAPEGGPGNLPSVQTGHGPWPPWTWLAPRPPHGPRTPAGLPPPAPVQLSLRCSRASLLWKPQESCHSLTLGARPPQPWCPGGPCAGWEVPGQGGLSHWPLAPGLRAIGFRSTRFSRIKGCAQLLGRTRKAPTRGGTAEDAEGRPLGGTQAACRGQRWSEADPRNSSSAFLHRSRCPSPLGPALSISLLCCHVHAARLVAHTGRREKDLARQGPAPGDPLLFGLEVEGGHLCFSSATADPGPSHTCLRSSRPGRQCGQEGAGTGARLEAAAKGFAAPSTAPGHLVPSPAGQEGVGCRQRRALAVAHSLPSHTAHPGEAVSQACNGGWWEHSGRNMLGLVLAKSRLWNRPEKAMFTPPSFSRGL